MRALLGGVHIGALILGNSRIFVKHGRMSLSRYLLWKSRPPPAYEAVSDLSPLSLIGMHPAAQEDKDSGGPCFISPEILRGGSCLADLWEFGKKWGTVAFSRFVGMEEEKASSVLMGQDAVHASLASCAWKGFNTVTEPHVRLLF